ncbi:nickel pincer cofactor biosynthesis protein LarB [Halarsenatibacter silvermanii]|uniref:PurE domain-containing protein n=1 Tax=Halarsenatibacter silvermanii TaxID=321763 RepID=A0A1G9PTH9_9FIRM|nr:nickel pincer cofactor biosynthesis protein LarB [Halarsenatibacter silvermanii]SDM02049.1 hypothetical protein SAMN04488692_11427 [Halarsenatibacter silvermanii]
MFNNYEKLKQIIESVEKGNISAEEAMENLKDPGYEDIGFAKIDHDRARRRGFPEVVLCEGKTPEQAAKIMGKMAEKSDNFLATRADPEVFEAVSQQVDDVIYNERGRVIIRENDPLPRRGEILLVSGGTADEPVVEEAAETAEIMGNAVEKLTDAGVAGVHRLLENAEKLYRARVIIVAAGMDGALPSVVAGLVDCPVVAVPTSAGYGTNLEGIAPLLTMLNSCASGIGVVNIDNGFGAAYLASSINKMESLQKYEKDEK